MRKITVEALRAGAFGFTTSRTDLHKTPDGELVPSRDDDYELLGIGQALGMTGTGAFGMNSDFDDEEFELRWIRKQARETGRPVWFLLTDRYSDPQRWRRLIKAVHGMRAEGLPVTAQMAGRPIGVMMGIGTALNPFTVRPSYKKLESLPIEEQRKRLRDPEVRRQILAETPSAAEIAKLAQFRQVVAKDFEKFFTMQPAGLRAGAGEKRGDRQARRPQHMFFSLRSAFGIRLYGGRTWSGSWVPRCSDPSRKDSRLVALQDDARESCFPVYGHAQHHPYDLNRQLRRGTLVRLALRWRSTLLRCDSLQRHHEVRHTELPRRHANRH